METNYSDSTLPAKKPLQLVRVHPRYVRLRQGSEIRYQLKLLRPPTKGKAVSIHVCVIMNKCGLTADPTELVISASDWRLPREVRVISDLNAEVRTVQIYHKIHENYDDVYTSNTIIPSVFVSVLQKEATFLFTFGCGLHGRLGTPDEQNANEPTPFSSKWLHPVQIACGKAHSAIIDVYSNIYCFGNNANGQLGQGDSNLEPSKRPLRVLSVGTGSVLQVACGSNHTMCMTTEGKIFVWGDNTYGQLGLGTKFARPRGIPTRVEKVVNVRNLYCGGNQSFIVTLDNNVLAAGSNIAGQLGLGDRIDRATFERSAFFRKLAAASSNTGTTLLTREQLLQVSAPVADLELACGPYHTLAVCSKRLYSWGNGDDGRLGHGSLESFLEPTLVSAFDLIPIRSIACGGSHSGALAANGDVYTWGNGHYGQIGIGSTKNRRVPTKIRLLQNKRVIQLSFGEWHSMALCEDGNLYAWGFGEEGQLGLPDDAKQKLTRVVSFPTIVSALSGTGATTVRCGSAHTFVISVLESRRPQLGKTHRRASRLEIMQETGRLETLERQKSRVLHGEKIDETDGLEDDTVKSKTGTSVSRKSDPKLDRVQLQVWKSERSIESINDDSEQDRVDWSWKDRPMTSRTAVRNALRQEAKVMTEMKEILTPRSAPPAHRAERARAAKAFISPRLKRLHEQVVRSSEAGVASARRKEVISNPAASQGIEEAVRAATAPLLYPQRMDVSFHGRPFRPSSHGTPRTPPPRHVVSYEMEMSPISTLSDDSEGEDDEEVVWVGSGHDTMALEEQIREQTRYNATK